MPSGYYLDVESMLQEVFRRETVQTAVEDWFSFRRDQLRQRRDYSEDPSCWTHLVDGECWKNLGPLRDDPFFIPLGVYSDDVNPTVCLNVKCDVHSYRVRMRFVL